MSEIEITNYKLSLHRGVGSAILRLEATVPPETQPGALLRLAPLVQLPPSAKDYVEAFISEKYHRIDGGLTLFSQFFSCFMDWLPEDAPSGIRHKQVVIKALTAAGIPYGRHGANRAYVGNVAAVAQRPSTRYVLSDGKLVKK